MQRRDLLTGLAAAAMSAPWSAAGSDPWSDRDNTDPAEPMRAQAHEDPALRLIPVFERFPQALAEPRPPGYAARFPLVIALGQRARLSVEHLGQHAQLPPDAGLYRAGPPASRAWPDWLQARLQVCESALLLIDTADPQALDAGLDWAGQLAAHRIGLRAALVLDAQRTGVPQRWRQTLGATLGGTVIVQRTRGATLGVVPSARMFLQGLPFLPTGAFVHERSDVIEVLSAGADARTTAVQWAHATIMPVAVRAAGDCLDLECPRGLIAWVHASEDFSIGDYADIRAQCERILPDDGNGLMALTLHPEWTTPHRVLSLTLVGEADGDSATVGEG